MKLRYLLAVIVSALCLSIINLQSVQATDISVNGSDYAPHAFYNFYQYLANGMEFDDFEVTLHYPPNENGVYQFNYNNYALNEVKVYQIKSDGIYEQAYFERVDPNIDYRNHADTLNEFQSLVLPSTLSEGQVFYQGYWADQAVTVVDIIDTYEHLGQTYPNVVVLEKSSNNWTTTHYLAPRVGLIKENRRSHDGMFDITAELMDWVEGQSTSNSTDVSNLEEIDDPFRLLTYDEAVEYANNHPEEVEAFRNVIESNIGTGIHNFTRDQLDALPDDAYYQILIYHKMNLGTGGDLGTTAHFLQTLYPDILNNNQPAPTNTVIHSDSLVQMQPLVPGMTEFEILTNPYASLKLISSNPNQRTLENSSSGSGQAWFTLDVPLELGDAITFEIYDGLFETGTASLIGSATLTVGDASLAVNAIGEDIYDINATKIGIRLGINEVEYIAISPNEIMHSSYDNYISITGVEQLSENYWRVYTNNPNSHDATNRAQEFLIQINDNKIDVTEVSSNGQEVHSRFDYLTIEDIASSPSYQDRGFEGELRHIRDLFYPYTESFVEDYYTEHVELNRQIGNLIQNWQVSMGQNYMDYSYPTHYHGQIEGVGLVEEIFHSVNVNGQGVNTVWYETGQTVDQNTYQVTGMYVEHNLGIVYITAIHQGQPIVLVNDRIFNETLDGGIEFWETANESLRNGYQALFP